MKQSKKHSHYEVVANQFTGTIIGWCIVMFIFPFFQHLAQSKVATISSILFFLSSYLRSYIIRRFFERIKK